jgi:predicted nucleic acid-binding Zn ribbon protein
VSSTDPRDDEPARLRDTLAAVGAELGLPRPGAIEALRAAWESAVGADVAAHAHVRALRDGVLTVVVDAPAWATQLRYREAQLVDWANHLTGPSAPVASVRLRVETGRRDPPVRP